ncbi:DUF6973 domain-containing protein [Streptomyces sp. NPDC017993]|uniref:DUF6973 domain-containing protein n=1 Tax=Streptomyces sp. NPDC017993 TaxID=3365027 RepID=UPI0037A5657F
MLDDPVLVSGPLGEELRAAQAQIHDALRMGERADERIAWDLKDDGGTQRNAFNVRVHMGRRLSPKEMLRQYQVTDDPEGMTTYFGEDVTQGEADILSELSAGEKLDFMEIRDQAWEQCQARFPDDEQDGHMDAFRHTYWNSLMAQRYGVDWAERYGSAHERMSGNPSDREAMDLHNNELGRRIAVENPTATPAQLAEKVQVAVQQGRTVVIDREGSLKRKVTAVLVAVVTLGAVWYVFREPAVVSTTDKALQKKVDRAIKGHPLPLAKMTGFAWDRLQVFAHDTSDGDISDAVGDRVEWETATTSYSGPSLWVFSKDGEAVRAMQMDTKVPAEKPSWSTRVQVSGGPYRNVLHFME